jgi:hypothetical protein
MLFKKGYTMKMDRSKELAINVAKQLNDKKGYELYYAYYVGKSMTSIYNVQKEGWYIFNKENNKVIK